MIYISLHLQGEEPMEQDKESEESAESDLGETGFKASCVCLQSV